jgi:hypothetical protein
MHDYHDYIYLRIPIEDWEQWIEEEKEEKNVKVDFKQLKAYRLFYQDKMENKAKSANKASLIKKARANLKIFRVLRDYYSGLFGFDKDITPYRLAKESGVSYPKVKKFWDNYNLDVWIDEFKSNQKSLEKFLYQNLAEDLVILDIKKLSDLDRL